MKLKTILKPITYFTMKPIKVLSLFDGMSCAQIALNRVYKGPIEYYASEIHKPSILVTQSNFPKTIQLGDIRNITDDVIDMHLKGTHIIVGGSPCTNLSIAGKKEGMITLDKLDIVSYEQYLDLKEKNHKFTGQSHLYWEYIGVTKRVDHIYRILENVVLKGNVKKWEKIITDSFGADPIRINSGLVSAQNRDRLYWATIPGITVPEDRNILISDVIPDSFSGYGVRGIKLNKTDEKYTYVGTTRKDFKSNCLTTSERTRMVSMYDGNHRSLTVEECEILQGVDEGYTRVLGVSQTQRYKMLGNGMTVPVLEHLFSFIPEFKKKKEYSR